MKSIMFAIADSNQLKLKLKPIIYIVQTDANKCETPIFIDFFRFLSLSSRFFRS